MTTRTRQTKRQRWEYQKSWRSKNRDKVNATARKWYKKNRERNIDSVRRYQLRRKYGFAQELYEVYFFMQCGECAICGRKDRRLVIDHNHKTGKIRGLLCTRCNLSIGSFEDSQELLLKAVMYLKKHG